MYQVKCDSYPLLDFRDDELILINPKVKIEVNTVGEGSFTIYKNHPYYDKLQKLKSIVEVSDEFGIIFRGRITDDTIDFQNGKAVDLEGLMAFFNDSIVRPYIFPNDFLDNADYTTAAESGNVVAFWLGWLISNHNSQVQDFQKFKLGNVTVSDPNNYISRSDMNYSTTWEVLKAKLFDSALGGYLCIRYEDDGNYIDYLSEFTITNTQDIDFGVNMLDLKHESDATETYSAIIPIGGEIEVQTTDENTDETAETEKKTLTIEELADGDITDDIVKSGDTLYSKCAVSTYGWRYAPVSDTTWSDVTEVQNLLTKGKNWLITQGMNLTDTVEITAVDLHFTDSEIRSFRLYRKINVNSLPYDLDVTYDLTKLNIDLLNPQNTKIVVGKTKLTLTDQNRQEYAENIQKIENVIKDVEANRTETTKVKNRVLTQQTTMVNTCNEIILGALESYVETGDYEEFKSTVESQLQILADEIELKFTENTTEIDNVNGDLQETNTTLSKYFEFTIDGLVIKSGESAITLHIDNDMIVFKKNGEQFGWWDGVDFHTGNIVVEVNERAQFGNFAFVPRSDGSLSFLKVKSRQLQIYKQPTDYTGAVGDTAEFNITAYGEGLTYQWQYQNVGTDFWQNSGMTGNKTNTVSIPITTARDGQKYRCVVTDISGNTATSNAATLHVS